MLPILRTGVCLLVWCMLPIGTVRAADDMPVSTDTLHLTLPDAERLALERSYILRARNEDVVVARAETRQTGLLENPQIHAELPLYTSGNQRWFDAGRNGQFAVSIEQTIPVTGQRGLAQRAGAARVEGALADVRATERQLLFSVRSAFMNYAYAQRSFRTLSTQLGLLDELINSYEGQLRKGNVSLRDVLRLKAAYYTVNDQRSAVHGDLLESRRALQVMLGTTSPIAVADSILDTASRRPPRRYAADSLVTLALGVRNDLQTAAQGVVQAEANADLEARRALSDPTVGIAYDKAGSYMPDYFALTLSVPIPILNRNQGNSEASLGRVRQAQAQLAQARAEVRSEVLASLDRLNILEMEFAKIDDQYRQASEVLTGGIIENYHKGNVSLLEFVDFFETYNQSIVQINRLSAARIIAQEQLNLSVGMDLVN